MSQTPQPPQSAQPQPPRPRKRRRKIPWYRKPEIMGPLAVATLIGVLGIIFNFPRIQHLVGLDNPNTAPTPTPVIPATPSIVSPDPLQQATKGTPALNDPLAAANNWKNYNASEGFCKFSDGAYHAIAPKVEY